MKTSSHIVTSSVLAAVLYAHSHSLPESAACLAGGVLIDLDHIPDFFLFSGERFSIRRFFSWYHEGDWPKLTILFHSYELYALLFAAAWYLDSAILHGLVWGTGLHLLLDQIYNVRKCSLSPWIYLLSYRIAAGFRQENLRRSS